MASEQQQFAFTPEMPRKIERFDGETYEAKRDGERLTAQLDRVRHAMQKGAWVTLTYLARTCGCSEASASARLRDLRKKRFGAHTIERRYQGQGVFAYRLKQE